MQYFAGFSLYLQLQNYEMAQCYTLDSLKSLWRDMYLVEEYNAKLYDFGLEKHGHEGYNTHVSTRVMGTYGYVSPEYVMTVEHFNQFKTCGNNILVRKF